MPCPDRLSQWLQQVSTAFGHLSKPQMCGLVRMSARGSRCREQQEQTMFQRLREWYLDAKHKSGKKRRELNVSSCFASLGKREPTNGAGLGCDDIRRALDDFIHQRGGVQVCDPGGMEGLSTTAALM